VTGGSVVDAVVVETVMETLVTVGAKNVVVVLAGTVAVEVIVGASGAPLPIL